MKPVLRTSFAAGPLRSAGPRLPPPAAVGVGAAVVAAVAMAALGLAGEPPPPRSPWSEIRVVDRRTGRGVPLVELATVNGIRFVTDDLGRVAFLEPGLMGRPVFFHARSPGYEAAADGFGYRGRTIVPEAGGGATIELDRVNVAERVCRLTGEGRLRDSILLGRLPAALAAVPGGVAGQDSVQAVAYGGRILWFWGDTNRLSHPLGLFRTAGGTTPVPRPGGPAIEPVRAIPFRYFVGPAAAGEPEGFVRPMMPLPERPDGVIWIDGACVVPDAAGRERLLAHYSRRRSLDEELEHGIAAWDDATASFVVARRLPAGADWRRPATHPIAVEEDGRRRLLFGAPTPNVRVDATAEAVLDPDRYEAFSCADADGGIARDGAGLPHWRWQRERPPTASADERRWIDAAALDPRHARFVPAAAGGDGRRVVLHSGTVRWNPHRRRWILVAGGIGGGSALLGETWYAEADAATGPFAAAVQIATHGRMSFYNVCHHDFLDADGGRTIHFEGTYSATFAGTVEATPRADYNQLLYRLDLDAPALGPAR